MRRFATYVRDHLAPELKVYVEYSNEVWNGIFVQNDYALQCAHALGLSPADVGIDTQPGDYWNRIVLTLFYAKRSLEIFAIWEEVFGGSERLVRVMAEQAATTHYADEVMLVCDNAAAKTDAVAIAPYFSGPRDALVNASTVDEIFDVIDNPDQADSLAWVIEHDIAEYAQVAERHGVRLIAYEGGQGWVDWFSENDDDPQNLRFYAADRDPRMGGRYLRYFQAWKDAGGGVFVHYTAPQGGAGTAAGG